MRRISIGVIAAFLAMSGLVVTSAPSAYACSCVGSPAEQGIAAADAIFLGTVVDKTEIPQGVAYTFRVERSYKGAVEGLVLVETGFGGGDCGFEHSVGDRSLVFGAGRGSTLTSSICASYGAGRADVERVLGPGTEPAQGGGAVETLPEVEAGPALGLSTVLYAAVAVLVPWLGPLLTFGL